LSNDYQVVDSRKVFQGKIFTIFVDDVRMPGGKVVEREILAHAGAVGIVPVTADNKVILVEQYRHATKGRIWEIPAGKLDSEEDPLDCAIRELEEETGAKTDKMEKIAEFYNAPGYSNERFHLYLARVTAIGPAKPDGDEEEDMRVRQVPLAEALSAVDTGEINDAKSIIGLLMTDRRLRQ